MKLRESIPSNGVKIIELYNKIDSGILDTSPDFQRKLVWKKQHKFAFIETILMNYPFPEVYIASSEMDVENLKSREIVVDGKQRLTAIVDYIKGINDFKSQKKIKSFDSLTTDEKRDFLNYLVSVKDLKDLEMESIKEVFSRINNTEYALNVIERTNAQFGDSEFAVFCKQIIDSNYTPTPDDTDVVIDKNIKSELNSFFLENKIFNENDKSRMFDIQYIMLIISTMLEGDYYSRSTKVNEYLEKYNESFSDYKDSLISLIKSIRLIKILHFSPMSYWFNKANLFTLIIELSKIDISKLDIEKLELQLLDLENKVDYYFSEDESIPISEDEKKYFEFARQGSHEKAARIHRGKLINSILDNSILKKTNSLVDDRIDILKENNILFTTIIPTKTGLEKSIMDATSSVREFFKINGIHDFEAQEKGTDYKIKIKAKYVFEKESKDLDISLYKANHRGDSRIWLSSLKEIASPNDVISIILKGAKIYILNISKLEIENLIGKPNLFNDIIINNLQN